MKDRIAVTVATDLNHTYESASDIIGREGEGNVSQLKITIPEALSNYAVYIDFKKPNGETIRTPRLKVESGVATYDVPLYILSDSGELKVQLVFQKHDGTIWKSSKKRYFIQKSINALDDIPEGEREDFMSEAQKLINQLNGEVNEIAEMLSNDQEFVNKVITNMEIPTFVTTIDGTPLKFFVGTQAEYNNLTADETDNLFAIITDDATKAEIFSKIDALAISNASLTTEIENLKTDVKEVETYNYTQTDSIIDVQQYLLKLFSAPSNTGMVTSTDRVYLDGEGYYFIQAKVTGEDCFRNFGLVYWDGVNNGETSACGTYNLNIYSNGGMSVTTDKEDGTQVFATARIYVKKFETFEG